MKKCVCLMMVVGLSCSSVFAAATYYFTGGAGTTNWQTSGNWSGNTLPTRYDYTYVGSSATNDMTVDISSGTAFAYRLYIGLSDMPEYEYTVNINGGYLSVANNNAHIYGGPKGILNVNSGNVSTWGIVFSGLEMNINNASSSFNVNSDHWQINGDTYINITDGSLNINNGSNFSCYNSVNYNPYFTGTINVAGGKIRFAGNDINAVNWHINNGNIIAYGGNPSSDLVVTYDGSYTWVEAVPEPATLVLLGMGSLVAVRRRRSS